MADYPDLNGKTREDAWELLTEWVTTPSLHRHCLAVETAMRAYAVASMASRKKRGDSWA